MASSISAKKLTTTHSPTKKMAIATTPSTATKRSPAPVHLSTVKAPAQNTSNCASAASAAKSLSTMQASGATKTQAPGNAVKDSAPAYGSSTPTASPPPPNSLTLGMVKTSSPPPPPIASATNACEPFCREPTPFPDNVDDLPISPAQSPRSDGGKDDNIEESPHSSPDLHPMFDLPRSPVLVPIELAPPPLEADTDVQQVAPPARSPLPAPMDVDPVPPSPSDADESATTAVPRKRKEQPSSGRIRAQVKRAKKVEQAGRAPAASQPRRKAPGRQSRVTVSSATRTSSAVVSKPTPPSTTTVPTASSTRSSPSTSVIATTTPSASSSPPPDWFVSAMGMLEAEDLGPGWRKLLHAWHAFEEAEHFKEKGKLPCHLRPAAIGLWIQRRRSLTWRPEFKDFCEYESQCMQWWGSLQPQWRVSAKGAVLFSQKDGDIESLRRPGLNGILSILAALLYWGSECRHIKASRKRWLAVVEDCNWVLDCLSGRVI
ncbi:hypothetical protein NLJ89_g11479 [Agrocybe chaxingu]|uniref:Uncharacterized protein n=1 Tax=Agrocybe chaxingu TaxID=84603 RepID=A0A9W8JPY3_9AGAR|nr:hypothetical protein NLJ89_g11479 [Agrocybe chaxingu]